MKQTSGLAIKRTNNKGRCLQSEHYGSQCHMVLCNRGKRFLWEIKGINTYYI